MLFNGEELSKTSDVLVEGLPEGFTIEVAAKGSQRNVGSSKNVIDYYVIRNEYGEDVTDHFVNVQLEEGTLTVSPMPLSVWTGSAEKTYDGRPLTEPSAGIAGLTNVNLWENLGYVSIDGNGVETLYVLHGTIGAAGSNPITGETEEQDVLQAQSMQVHIYNLSGEKTISFDIAEMKLEELPEDLLRLFQLNPELIAFIWDEGTSSYDLLMERIHALPETDAEVMDLDGLIIDVEHKDQIIHDFANVKITIDTDITGYDDRPLNEEEAVIRGLSNSEGISVAATGSQTEVGSSLNGYEMHWNGADPANYTISERLGTLTVRPRPTRAPTPRVTPEPTAQPEPEITVTPSPTPYVYDPFDDDDLPTYSAPPTATPTPTPTATPTPTPTTTPTPTPTATPTPTPTATPEVIIHKHKLVTDETKPSCENGGTDGTRVTYCSECDEYVPVVETIPFDKEDESHHVGPIIEETVPSTCTEHGTRFWICEACGFSGEEKLPLDYSDEVHTWGTDYDAQVIDDKKCILTVCSECGYTRITWSDEGGEHVLIKSPTEMEEPIHLTSLHGLGMGRPLGIPRTSLPAMTMPETDDEKNDLAETDEASSEETDASDAEKEDEEASSEEAVLDPSDEETQNEDAAETLSSDTADDAVNADEMDTDGTVLPEDESSDTPDDESIPAENVSDFNSEDGAEQTVAQENSSDVSVIESSFTDDADPAWEDGADGLYEEAFSTDETLNPDTALDNETEEEELYLPGSQSEYETDNDSAFSETGDSEDNGMKGAFENEHEDSLFSSNEEALPDTDPTDENNEESLTNSLMEEDPLSDEADLLSDSPLYDDTLYAEEDLLQNDLMEEDPLSQEEDLLSDSPLYDDALYAEEDLLGDDTMEEVPLSEEADLLSDSPLYDDALYAEEDLLQDDLMEEDPLSEEADLLSDSPLYDDTLYAEEDLLGDDLMEENPLSQEEDLLSDSPLYDDMLNSEEDLLEDDTLIEEDFLWDDEEDDGMDEMPDETDRDDEEEELYFDALFTDETEENRNPASENADTVTREAENPSPSQKQQEKTRDKDTQKNIQTDSSNDRTPAEERGDADTDSPSGVLSENESTEDSQEPLGEETVSEDTVSLPPLNEIPSAPTGKHSRLLYA